MKEEDIFSPVIIFSFLNPGLGVGRAPDASTKQQGGGDRQEVHYLGTSGSEESPPTSY